MNQEEKQFTSDKPKNYKYQYEEVENCQITVAGEEIKSMQLNNRCSKCKIKESKQCDNSVKCFLNFHKQSAYDKLEKTDLNQLVCFHLQEFLEIPKTYNTEDTPENVSIATSTSLPDLITSSHKNSQNSSRISPVNFLSDEYKVENVVQTLLLQPEETVTDQILIGTPLVFSRCSSFDSLSSYDPPDDISSIFSELSHMPSGIVSPSELPDSPIQTTSPTLKTQPVDFDSVFKEQVLVFNEENTPVEFSTATSLSNLILEEDQPMRQVEDFPLIDEEEEENMLKACIKFGMQQNNKSKSTVAYFKPLKSKSTYIFKNNVLGDNTTVFYTEDTPINISHASSYTDLSYIRVFCEESDQNLTQPECIETGMPKVFFKPNSHQKVGSTSWSSTGEVSMLSLPQISNIPSKPSQLVSPNFEKGLPQDFLENLSNLTSIGLSESMPPSPISKNKDILVALSRQPSLEYLNSEWAQEQQDQILLEQCINSGMPKTRKTMTPTLSA